MGSEIEIKRFLSIFHACSPINSRSVRALIHFSWNHICLTKINKSIILEHHKFFSYFLNSWRFVFSQTTSEKLKRREWVPQKWDQLLPITGACTNLTHKCLYEKTTFVLLLNILLFHPPTPKSFFFFFWFSKFPIFFIIQICLFF